MKSRLSLTIVLFGWLIFFAYLSYDFSKYGSHLLGHFFSPENMAELFLHVIIVATIIGSSITGYLVNERKKLIETLRANAVQLELSAVQWQSTFDSIPYGVAITDNKCFIKRANACAMRLANGNGVSEKRCYEVFCSNSIPPDDCPTIVASITRAQGSREFVHTSGRRFTETITPVLDNNGEIREFIHVLIDITDLKHNEEMLRRSKDAFFNMLKDLHAANRQLREIHDSLIITFSHIIDAKSHWTKGHSIKTTQYALLIAKKMGIDSYERDILQRASLLHDIGKIGTYDIVLDKPDRLNDFERSLIRQHPLKAVEILSPIKGFEPVIPIIRSHHERMDGRGYPDGLRGEEIPLLARILSVADAYDAMMSDRPYRRSKGREYAVSELRRCSGTQFDPRVVDALISIVANGRDMDELRTDRRISV